MTISSASSTRPSFPELETVPCPLGCIAESSPVVRGHDRLNGMPGVFEVVRCARCGLMRTSPRPTPSSIGQYYPDDYGPYEMTRVADGSAAPASAPRKRRFGFSPLTHPLPDVRPGRMLEIGCGSGSFLHEMAGRQWEVSGIEFSPTAAARARSLGFPVQTGALETATPPGAAFDLVVGWMVLEHLHDPVGALRRLREWIDPDGWLVLSVPDARALERRVFGDAWYALSLPTHLYHYTPRTLRAMLAAGGWRAERFFWQRNPDNLLHSMRYRAEERRWQRTADFLRGVTAGRRMVRARALLGLALGVTRQSGRMTVWARPGEVRGTSPGSARAR